MSPPSLSTDVDTTVGTSTGPGRVSLFRTSGEGRRSSSPEFVALILCGSSGARMFPLSTESYDGHDDAAAEDDEDTTTAAVEDGGGDDGGRHYRPKHLLPVAGISVLTRLLSHVRDGGFQECVVACSALDRGVTLRAIRNEPLWTTTTTTPSQTPSNSPSSTVLTLTGRPDNSNNNNNNTVRLTVLDLPADCDGSGDALHFVTHSRVFSPHSHVVVLPGDLVLVHSDTLGALADAHRRNNDNDRRTALTMLLSNVGEEDDQGLPLKESSKQKKGGLARDEEDMEYIALGSTPTSPLKRVLMKRTKLDVEEDEDMDGTPPQLTIPKYRLRGGGQNITTITTDLSDLHVYAIAPWVLRMLESRKEASKNSKKSGSAIHSLQTDLLPLLISRQFRGVAAAFGRSSAAADVKSRSSRSQAQHNIGNNSDNDSVCSSSSTTMPSGEFVVAAHVLSRTNNNTKAAGGGGNNTNNNTASGKMVAVRSSTVPAYLYACRELLLHASAPTPTSQQLLPPGCQLQSKYHSVLMAKTSVGEKLKIQNSTVGSHCKVGARCKLNNVVVMDNVVIGDNCTLQNSVLCSGVVIADNCSLNDCQMGYDVQFLEKGKKLKGESQTKD